MNFFNAFNVPLKPHSMVLCTAFLNLNQFLSNFRQFQQHWILLKKISQCNILDMDSNITPSKLKLLDSWSATSKMLFFRLGPFLTVHYSFWQQRSGSWPMIDPDGQNWTKKEVPNFHCSTYTQTGAQYCELFQHSFATFKDARRHPLRSEDDR